MFLEVSIYFIIKQGDSDSEVIICFGTKYKLSVDLIQLLKVKTVLGFTLRHCHKLLRNRIYFARTFHVLLYPIHSKYLKVSLVDI